ncbi:hypothetical protein H0H93_006162 [Arthromyces matolae]|nr:hypothetical protein H0H93_006162 [Arthromyces matolae]
MISSLLSSPVARTAFGDIISRKELMWQFPVIRPRSPSRLLLGLPEEPSFPPPKELAPPSALAQYTPHIQLFTMLITHEILSACFLLAFVATATPIPTPPHLLPRTLSDLPSTSHMMRDTAGARNNQDSPDGKHTSGQIETPTEDPGSDTEIEDAADGTVQDELGRKHKPGSQGFFLVLLGKMGAYAEDRDKMQRRHKLFAEYARSVALHLPELKDHDSITTIAHSLILNRLRYKQIALDWSSDTGSEPSPDHWKKTAIAGIQGWENMLQIWTSKSEFQNIRPAYDPRARADVEKHLQSILDIDDIEKVLPNYRKPFSALRSLVSSLIPDVLSMSINDTQHLHAKLEEVSTHVQSNWLSAWPKSGKGAENAKAEIGKSLETIRKYIIVFGATSTATATTSKTVAT